MIRNLKVLLLAGMAVAVFGALGASSASAAEYHCDVEPCRVTLKPDETSGTKTAHHVFDFQVNGGSITTVTCNQITGEGTSATKTTATLSITSLAYDECNVGGQAATVDTTGCSYKFKAAGGVNVECGTGSIKVTFGTCTVSVPTQELKSGVSYHNIGTTEAKTTEATVETLVKEINGSTTAGCPGGAGTFKTGEYTTGNTRVTGETDNVAAEMTSVWYL